MTPSPEQIRAQLEKLLQAEVLAASPRQSRFLRYVVERTLAGEEDRLKAYTIGVDVFDRPEDFDASADNTVRVAAGRLRKTLQAYYLSEGAEDEVIIQVPKGTYAPVFSLQQPSEFPSQAKAGLAAAGSGVVDETERLSRRKKSHFIINFVLVAAAVLLISLFLLPRDSQNATFREAAQVSDGPSIMVMPFESLNVRDSDETLQVAGDLSSGLYFDIVDKLSRFPDIVVIQGHHAKDESPAEMARRFQAQYYLTGSVLAAEKRVRISVALSRAENGEVIWTSTEEALLEDASSFLEIESEIASRIAAELGASAGALRQRFELETSKLEDVEAEHYLCLRRFYRYLNQVTEAEHADVRDCLERATRERPGFSSGWAALSWMYGEEKRNQFNPRPDAAPPRLRAYEAALKGVEADPENAMAHQYLSIVRYSAGDIDGFRRSAERSLQLNPNDPDVLADVGSHLIQIENSKEGVQLVEKAIRLNPGHPPWYHGSILRHYYLKRDYATALSHARAYAAEESLMSLGLLVSCLVRGGEIEEAKQTYEKLKRKFPQFERDYNAVTDTWGLSDDYRKMLLEDLTVAGLQLPPS